MQLAKGSHCGRSGQTRFVPDRAALVWPDWRMAIFFALLAILLAPAPK